MFKRWITVVFTVIILKAAAQNPLPDFSVDSLGKNRTRISWVNTFGEGVIQLNVQFSYDSIKNFKTLFTSPSPQLPQNGYVDVRPNGGKMYYRIFYAFAGGSYTFTKSKSIGTGPVLQSDEANNNIIIQPPVDYNSPSRYIVLNAHGFPEIRLADADGKKYKVLFFDENHTPLFTLTKVTGPTLVIDKTNFLHAGTFYFEIYNGDKLVEKNRIYLAKEF